MTPIVKSQYIIVLFIKANHDFENKIDKTNEKLENFCEGEGMIFIAACQVGFIVPYVREIVVRKNLTNFEGCHFARFYILIRWSFPKIETKNFNSGPCLFKLVKLGTIWPAAHFLNCVYIGRSQTTAATIFGLSSGKRFVKLREVF